MEHGFTLFDTAIGECGIAWNERGVACVALPGHDRGQTYDRLARAVPGAVESPAPPSVRTAVSDIVRHLRGGAGDLTAIDLDMSGVSPFHRQVYEAARSIPPGKTLTYGEIARQLGRPGAARAVGQALGRNPFAVVVPCHRVVAAGGRLGGFSASGGVTTKLGLLAIERAAEAGLMPDEPAPSGFRFDPATALAYLSGSDPGLAGLIATVGPFAMELNATASVFSALAEAIVHQQLSTKAAATIHRRLCALLLPGTGTTLRPEHILGATDEQLRSVGLSRPKIASMRDLAHKVASGALPELEAIREMDDEAVVACLSSVRGIGRWTAHMFLMFRLGRADVLPLDDLGLRSGFAQAFHLGEQATREQIEERAVLWRPYRSVATWYLWQALERTRQGLPV
ncbi:methylated-DNA--[protein]-cysteine S-methyltransferase [Streptomyces sp. NPDC019990]|uniref:methylated-DNA--[protein]-cysteine S-methyltransferase n=1 Tax=Streptomyces sp. NPDC019990 TaxID=3154693 RepID=UPI0033E33831